MYRLGRFGQSPVERTPPPPVERDDLPYRLEQTGGQLLAAIPSWGWLLVGAGAVLFLMGGSRRRRR